MSQTTPPPLDPLPPAPNVNSPSTFSALADAFLAALLTFRTQLVALAANVYNNAVDAFNNAVSAAASAATASAAASTASAGAGALPFNPSTSYTQGQGAISLVNFQTYRRRTAGTSATDPANDPTNWAVSLSSARLYSPRANNIQLTQADNGKIIDVTSGTFTQTIDPGASLGAGWNVLYRVSGSGVVTIDPNNAEQIGGSNILVPISGGQTTYFITWDGTAFQVILLLSSQGYLKVSDQKASGTAGGNSIGSTITSTRTFNTVEKNTINGASLASNLVTLPAGTYRVKAWAPFYAASGGVFKIFLYNTTDSTYTLIGESASGTAGGIAGLSGEFSITSIKVFSVRYWCNPSDSSGLGLASTSGQVEVYAQAEFIKVA